SSKRIEPKLSDDSPEDVPERAGQLPLLPQNEAARRSPNRFRDTLRHVGVTAQGLLLRRLAEANFSAGAVLAPVCRVRYSMKGVSSNGIFCSRSDSDPAAVVLSIWMRSLQGSSLMREPSGRGELWPARLEG